MFRLRIPLIAFALLVGLFAPAQTAERPRQNTLEWLTLAPGGEGFSVSLPVKPEEQTDRVEMMGNTYRMRLYTSPDEANRMLYMVIMQEFPPLSGALTPAAKLENFMAGFKEGLNKSMGTADTKIEMQLDRELDFKGHLGRQYKLTFGAMPGLVRAFDGSPRIFVLVVMGADEKNSSVGRFFDSFEIKPAPAPVSQPLTETRP